MIPHSLIMKCLNLFGIASNNKRLLGKRMVMWSMELTTYGRSLGTIEIRKDTCPGDYLYLLIL